MSITQHMGEWGTPLHYIKGTPVVRHPLSNDIRQVNSHKPHQVDIVPQMQWRLRRREPKRL